jgi:AAA domain/Toprim-like
VPDGFGAAELLGWTPVALRSIGELRGWTEQAIERLELAHLAEEHRVGIPVRDELGTELGELHYDPTGQRRPKMLADAGTPRTLFPPPELLADDELPGRRLWLVEGEPDAIRLWSLGLPAVAVPGAGNWRDEWAARFTGRRWTVIVCFDCDEAGREGARRAAGGIVEAGGDARIVELDADRDDGFDLTDWTRAADTPELRRQAAELLTSMADTVELYRPERVAEGAERPWRSVPWSTFRDTAPPAHRWLVDGLLPAGVLCFVAGPPKRGKTWIGIGLALSLALGRPFADDAYPVPAPLHVLYVALEGSQTGLRTRIGALARGAGVDPDGHELERLHMLYRPRPFDLAELATSDWLLEEAIDVDAQLVFVDVLRAAARFQENVAEDFARIRDHLEPLLAGERTVALLHHFGKLTETQKERSPGERMAGTGAMYGALDVGFLITRSDHGAREMRVDVEARDFAAPDALGLVIDGEGSGKHGGFTYADRATLLLDEAAAGREDLVALTVELLADERWRSGDELAEELGKGRRAIEDAIEADTKARKRDELDPRVVRWDRDGRELPAKPDGKPWAWNAKPWGLFETLNKGSVGSQPSQPSLLGELGSKGSVPSKEGDRATEPFESPVCGATEPTEP